jgi:hypothetical protein
MIGHNSRYLMEGESRTERSELFAWHIGAVLTREVQEYWFKKITDN